MPEAIHAHHRSTPRKPGARPGGHLVPAVLFLAIALGGTAAAAAEGPPLLDRFSFTVGSFFTSTDTDLRFDGFDRIGDRFNFERNLAFDDSETLLRFNAEFRIKRRHLIRLGFYDLTRSATTVLEREIDFGEVTFPVSADVEAFFDTRVMELSYTYWLVLKDKAAFGLAAGGVNFFSFDVGLGTTGGQIELIEQEASTDVPVPLFGLEVRYAVAPKLRLRASGRLISVSGIGSYSGSIVDLGADLEYRAFGNVGFGVAFSSISLDVEREERAFTGRVEYQINGFELFLRAGF